uniref:F-box domain-containing protein n=1 Tax=Strongyloides papillosus TaxID=174720 RepID=A0A0N5BZR4_STREA
MLVSSESQKPVILEKAGNGKTSCEIVFDCPELVTMVYKNLSDLKDKSNFIRTCKTFFNSVEKIKSLPEECGLNGDFFDINDVISIDDTVLHLHRDYLVITPGRREIHDGQLVNNVNKKIKMNTKNTRKLYISPYLRNWNQVTRKLNSFENIKHLKIGWDLKLPKLNFFNYLTTLNPDTIYLMDRQCTLFARDGRNYKSSNENWSFPRSVKRFIIKYRGCLPISRLLEGLSNFGQNEIDFLELIPTCFTKSDFINCWNKFIRLTDYFKRIDITSNYIIYEQGFYNCMKRLSSIDNNSKFWFNLKANIDSSFWNEIDHQICLKVRLLCILNNIVEGRYVDENLASTIYRTLFMMHGLETLMFGFTITDLGVNFASFIHNVSRKLKNIQITDCEKMKLIDLQTMAAHFKDLHTLSLHGIKSDDITLKEIFDLFPKIKVLEVFYKKSFKDSQVLDFFKGQKLNDGSYKFVWPKTVLLNIFTYYPNEEEFHDFQMVEKTIPRKSGQLLYSPDRSYFKGKTDILRVTLQQSSGCYNHLEVFKAYSCEMFYELLFYQDLLYGFENCI